MNAPHAEPMLRRLRPIALALIVLLPVGGSPLAFADSSISPFAGSWSGTYEGVGCCGKGTLEWTFSDSGRLTGTGYDPLSGIGRTFVGHIGDDGKVTLKTDVEGGGGGSGDPWAGTAVINKKGQFVATFIANYDNALRIDVTLHRVR